MVQPTKFNEFPRTFTTGVLTNPSGTILDTGVFDATRVFKLRCIVSGTVAGTMKASHIDTDNATEIEAVAVVLNGAPAEFYWLWLIETNQRVKIILPSPLTGTLSVIINLYQAAAGP